MGEEAYFANPTGLIASTLLVAALAAVPLSLLILARYRAAVVRSMQQGAAPAQQRASTIAARELPELRLANVARAEPAGRRAPASLLAELRHHPYSLARCYAICALVQALLAALVLLAAEDIAPSPGRLLCLSYVLAWPVIPQLAQVSTAAHKPGWRAPALFAAGAIALGAVFGLAGWLLVVWLGIMGFPTLSQLLLANRRIRNVAPFVTALLVFLLLGVFSTLALILMLGIRSDAFVVFALLLGIGAIVLLGRRFARWVGATYAAKRTSDQMLLVDAWSIVYTAWLSVWLSISIGWYGVLAGALPFAVSRSLLAVLLRRRALRRPPDAPRRLLLLRVFGFRSRSERLLADLERRWRHDGIIQLIAGADLANAILTPHELLEYAGGRLGRSFVADAADLEARLAARDELPDPDGRYRIHELFCFESTWRLALRRLAGESDAVLMDLRGFSREHRGCVYELQQLVDLVPTGAWSLLLDGDTDRALLEATLRDGWSRMAADSPNRAPDAAPVRIFDLSSASSPDADILLAATGATG